MVINGGTYVVNGFFKTSGRTLIEKFYSLMEKEVENPGCLCYNDDIPQESPSCRQSKEGIV